MDFENVIQPIDVTINILQLIVVLSAAIWGYFKFFREGKHRERIEFDIDLIDLGLINDYRVVEIGCCTENKGYVEQIFNQISLKVRGIREDAELF